MATFYGPRAPVGPNDGDEWVNQTTGERRVWAGNGWRAPSAGGQVLLADGSASAPGLAFSGAPNFGLFRNSGGGRVGVAVSGACTVAFGSGVVIQDTSGLYWSSGSDPSSGGVDVALVRDAAGTLAQRNGTNAQAFNIANTYTDASNYERLDVAWSANVCVIGTAAAGTGSARTMRIGPRGSTSLFLGTGDTSRFTVDGFGNFSPAMAQSTGMTNGFIQIPGAAGAPSGTPGSTTGFSLYWDSTNLKLYVYTGGAWKASAAFS